MKPEIRQAVHDAAEEFGLAPSLVEAVVMVESSGRPNAYKYEPGFWLKYMAHQPQFQGKDRKVWSASYGLMQTMVTTAMSHGFSGEPDVLKNPHVSLFYGCTHLKGLIKSSGGDVEQALCRYNGGDRGNKVRPFRNAAYAAKVFEWQQKIEASQAEEQDVI
jgi:soluble lytic murein transglycosylase-like protein